MIADEWHKSGNVGNFSMGLDAATWSASFYVDNVWDERGTTFANNRWTERHFGVNQSRTFGFPFRKRFR